MFVNVRNAPRVVIPPSSEKALVSPCVPLCAIFLREPGGVPIFTHESEREPFVGEVERCDEKRFGTKFIAAALPDISLLLVLRVHREPGNVCI